VSLCLALADDFSGALEVGAKFAGQGIASVVTTRPQASACAPALVIDTETRHVTAPQAAASVRRLAAEARGLRLIFKKTDSTLRGNIAAELSALAAACPGSPVVYVPAYPEMGRTVRGGQLLVNGVPVHQTEFARDPLNPIHDSRIPAAPGVEIRDAQSPEEVGAIAEEFLRGEGTLLAAGPAAFAEAIARRIDLPRAAVPAFPWVRRCLIINGSPHPRSAGQIAAFRGAAGWLVCPDPPPGAVGRRLDAECFDALIIFGGDTAYAIMEALGVHVLRPVGDIVPGVPLSRFEFGGRELCLITKAGGFGDIGILQTIRERL
jgi:D-threonate/D-erythronate kinase